MIDDDLSLARFYITLKSCSKAILVGPVQMGKVALVESAGKLLTDEPERQCQQMVGHARWASGSWNVTSLVEAQASLNSYKLMTLLEEASLPENTDRLFIACLTQVSPAELHSLFAVPGLLSYRGAAPIPFPHNFRLIGTIDTVHFRWWTPELLSHTAVILWPGETTKSQCQHPLPFVVETRQAAARLSQPYSASFLRSSIRDEQVAYTQLIRLWGRRQPFRPLIKSVTMLQNHDIHVPPEAINRAIVFMANAWSQDGVALLLPSGREVTAALDLALDLALVQYILPWIMIAGHPGRMLCRQLNRLLDGRFPQAAAFLQAQAFSKKCRFYSTTVSSCARTDTCCASRIPSW
ncbi:MAG: hypothetical protein R6X32_17500 [Chloroflexota bacterium]